MCRALVFAISCACSTPHGPPYPPPLLPSLITVTEGFETSFLIGLTGGPMSVSAQFVTADGMSCPAYPLSVSPCAFTLDGSPYPVPITVRAARDDDMTNNHYSLALSFTGDFETYGFSIRVVDIDAPNLIASNWNVMIEAGGSTDFTVRMTQPPIEDVIVDLSPSGNTASLEITPASLVFAAATFDVPQTVTLHAAATGPYANVYMMPRDDRVPGGLVRVDGPFDDDR